MAPASTGTTKWCHFRPGTPKVVHVLRRWAALPKVVDAVVTENGTARRSPEISGENQMVAVGAATIRKHSKVAPNRVGRQ